MKGQIHSFESFGTVDGPGVRYVVFFQGCPMRCLYCHNPDTWDLTGGIEIDVEEILQNFEKNRAFYRNGGITATGGEPLMQLEFLTELFSKAREKNIHTCLDTSGILFAAERKEAFEKLIGSTNLVMLDIKHMDLEEHKKLTGHPNENVFAFAEFLRENNVPMRIRHVVVPDITLVEAELVQLGTWLRDFPNLEQIEVLPYHSLGKVKYENLSIEYPLNDIPQVSREKAAWAQDLIEKAIHSGK